MDNTASCMIEVCDLHKHYKDVHVLRGISTTVAKGEVCAVIGPSGSGKSTFLRCLNRLEEASSGEIFINAQEITDPHLNLNKMRENIGMVFQGFNLFPHMTAIQNIMLAPVNVRGLSHKEAEAYGMELLSRAGRACSLPRWALRAASTTCPASCRAGSSSAWPSPARSPCAPKSCSSTSLPAPLTRK